MSNPKHDRIKALVLARSLLVDEESRTVCGALTIVSKRHRKLLIDALYLKNYIRESLSGSSYLHNWQRKVGIEPGLLYTEKGKNDRIAWIDWMIQCYKEDA